jgi:hypothetical protein
MTGAGFPSHATFWAQILYSIADFSVHGVPQVYIKCPWVLWHSAENLRAVTLGLRHSTDNSDHIVGIPQFVGERWLAFRGTFVSGMSQV